MSGVPDVLWQYVEGLTTHDVKRIASTLAEDVAFVAATRTIGKDAFLRMIRAVYAAFPDWSYAHDPPEPGTDVITIRWRQGGTHTETFTLPDREPIPATGKRVQIPEQRFFYKVRDDKIVEIRPDPIPGGAPDAILQSIGADPPQT